MLREEVVNLRLKELDTILQELEKYKNIDPEALRTNLSQRWIIERGLQAGAELIFEIGDHILSSHFSHYSETYEDTLKALFQRDVISEDLYLQIKGLGGLRNILVHQYTVIDTDLVFNGFQKCLKVFPLFAREVLQWLKDEQPEPEQNPQTSTS